MLRVSQGKNHDSQSIIKISIGYKMTGPNQSVIFLLNFLLSKRNSNKNILLGQDRYPRDGQYATMWLT